MKHFRELPRVLFFIIVSCTQVLGQVCDYRYTRQPPLALSCNPYDGANRLTLTCSVEGPNFPRFTVIWFRKVASRDEQLRGSQQGVNIEVTETSSVGGNAQFIRRSSLLSLTGLNQVDDIGDYWCQVRLNNGSSFQERSNMLALYTEAVYLALSFSRCFGSEVIDQEKCLTLLTMAPTVTDSGAPSNSESTAQTTVVSSFFDFTSTSQTTSSFIEKSENCLTTLYAIIAVIVVFAIMILVFGVAIGLIRCKQKHIARYNEDEGRHEQPETRSPTEHQPLEAETTAASEHRREIFDFKENEAYNSSPVDNITLTENVAYGTTMPPRAASSLEAEYEEIDKY